MNVAEDKGNATQPRLKTAPRQGRMESAGRLTGLTGRTDATAEVLCEMLKIVPRQGVRGNRLS